MTATAARRRLTIAFALTCAGADLAVKLGLEAAFHHPRSDFAILLSLGLAASLVALVPRLPSATAAVAAGVGAGGAVGNSLGAIGWSSGVPDPLVVSLGPGIMAFNLADVFALSGAAMLVVTAGLYALRHADALRQPL